MVPHQVNYATTRESIPSVRITSSYSDQGLHLNAAASLQLRIASAYSRKCSRAMPGGVLWAYNMNHACQAAEIGESLLSQQTACVTCATR
ncbi:hypothetical protein MLD38_008255 [Melastoma candidum]|uniref:Uncharacterized protein n=1 Tax=Melastoma candidum TaxID=119954 RepID=A0ACB9RTP0_9MYRT|nr:hypothetical protein MLD38_008255 [Melastoma candidum]